MAVISLTLLSCCVLAEFHVKRFSVENYSKCFMLVLVKIQFENFCLVKAVCILFVCVYV